MESATEDTPQPPPSLIPDAMNMRPEKRSLALLSSKRTKAYTRSIADETFSLPSFSDTMPPFAINGVPQKSIKVLSSMHREHDNNVEKLKQRMLEHEVIFKEQLVELHRLYHVQRQLMVELETMNPTRWSVASHDATPLHYPGSLKRKGEQMLWDIGNGGNLGQAPFPAIENDLNKSCAFKRRPVIDLEQPAAEDMDFKTENEPHGFLGTGKVSLNPPDLNCSVREIANGIDSGTIPSDEKMNSGGDVRKKGISEIQFLNIDDDRKSSEGASKLPHWLLESVTATKAAVQSSTMREQPLPLFMQKHKETKIFGERILSNSGEVSSSTSYSCTSLCMNSQHGEGFLKESLSRSMPHETATGTHDLPLDKRNFPTWLHSNRISASDESVPVFSNRKVSNIYTHTASQFTSSSYPPPQPSASASCTSFGGIQTANVVRQMSVPEFQAGIVNSPVIAPMHQQNLFSSATLGQVSQPVLGFDQNSFHLSDTNFLGTPNCNVEKPGIYQLRREEGNGCDPPYEFLTILRPEIPSYKTTGGSVYNGSNIVSRLQNHAVGELKSTRHELDLNVQICEDLVESNSNTEAVDTAITEGRPMDGSPALIIPPQPWGSLHRPYASQSISCLKPNSFLDESNHRERASPEIGSVRSTVEKEGNHDIRRDRKRRGASATAASSCGGSVLTKFESREAIATSASSSLPKVHGKSRGSSDEVWRCRRASSSANIQLQKAAIAGQFSADYTGNNFPTTAATKAGPSMMGTLPATSCRDDVEIVAGILMSFGNDWLKEAAALNDGDDGKRGRSGAEKLLRSDGDEKQGRGSLEQLADAIAEVENNEGVVCIDSGESSKLVQRSDGGMLPIGSHGEEALDWFEQAVLRLKPMSPGAEKLCESTSECGCEGRSPVAAFVPPMAPAVAPASNAHRRRSPRRGKACCKDFQKDVLSSMVSLSRHEIAEDLQMVEGLIESTMAMAMPMLKPMLKPMPMPMLMPMTAAMASNATINNSKTGGVEGKMVLEHGSEVPKQRQQEEEEAEEGEGGEEEAGQTTTRTSKSCISRNNNSSNAKKRSSALMLRLCTWGESSRRKRMRRRRSHCPPLIPSLLS